MFSAYVLAGHGAWFGSWAWVFVVTAWFAHLQFAAPLWIVLFAFPQCCRAWHHGFDRRHLGGEI